MAASRTSVRPVRALGQQEQLDHRRLGELGGPAEAAPLGVVAGEQGVGGDARAARRATAAPSVAGRPTRRSGRPVPGRTASASWSAPSSSSARRSRHSLADLAEQVDEAGPREVGAAEERPAVGQQEHRHRPAAAAGDGLDRLHVDASTSGRSSRSTLS